jgi:hypothetical protein
MKKVKIVKSGTGKELHDAETDSVLWCWNHGHECNPNCVAAKVYPVIRLGDDGSETPGEMFECVAEPGCRIKFKVVE